MHHGHEGVYRMYKRTTILLDEASRQAARDLAHQFGCSTSEAIRRVLVEYSKEHPPVRYATPERRQERVKALHRLIEMFAGHDAQAEIDELKRVDAES